MDRAVRSVGARRTASCSTSRAAAVATRAGSSSGDRGSSPIDRDLSGVDDLRGDPRVELVEFDLEVGAPFPVAGRTFAAVVVTNYLWRPILDDVARAVAPGGWLLYETFAVGNERLGHPTNPDFLLQPGELLDLARAHGLHVVAYEHLEVDEPRPAVIQRLAATRS